MQCYAAVTSDGQGLAIIQGFELRKLFAVGLKELREFGDQPSSSSYARDRCQTRCVLLPRRD